MLRKKVCMLGATGVGKTSLVRRFVESIFSEDYLSTVGVKVDRKVVTLDGRDVTLLLWDIHGEHGSLEVLPAYLSGSSAHLVVIDAARAAETAEVALTVLERSEASLGPTPYVVALNKADLVEDWAATEAAVSVLAAGASAILRTSAKTGERVEAAFSDVATAAVG